MARDDLDFKVPITRWLLTKGAIATTSTANQQLYRSIRSDAVATDPWPDGTYHEVTGYRAFFSNVSYLKGSVFYDTSTRVGSNIYTTDYEYRWTGPEVPSYIWRAGCDSYLYPVIPNELLARVRASIDAQVRDDLNLSTFAGEARETASTLVQILRKLVKICRNVRRLRQIMKGDMYDHFASNTGAKYGLIRSDRWDAYDWYTTTFGQARDLARDGSSAARVFLTYMYGIKPLVNDVIKIANHWDQRCEAPISKKIFAQCEEDFVPTGTSSTRTVSGKCKRGVETGAYAYVYNPQALRASQYGLTSPFTLAWELMTLSFVVDWFTGIGSFIQGLERPFGVYLRDYYETQWVNCAFAWEIDYYGELGSPGLLRGPRTKARADIRIRSMFRQRPPRQLPPPPYLTLGVNSSQALSLIALLAANAK